MAPSPSTHARSTNKLMRLLHLSLIAVLSVAAAAPAPAQDERTPSIVTSGRGQVALTPTKARLTINSAARAPTAAAASAQNDRRLAQVLSALRKQGSVDSIHVTGVSVSPNEDDDGKFTDFGAEASVMFLVTRLDSLNAVLDAAIEAGATGLGRVSFEAEGTIPARREALRRAVADAQRDAESLASAVNRPLGALLNLSTDPAYLASYSGFEEASVTRGFQLAEFGNAQSGIIRIGPTPREVIVTANVSARWLLGP